MLRLRRNRYGVAVRGCQVDVTGVFNVGTQICRLVVAEIALGSCRTENHIRNCVYFL